VSKRRTDKEGTGRATGKVEAYDCGLKKCASTSCWGLNLSMSDKVSLPKYKDHVFPLFENTTLTQSEKDALTAEGIKFDEEARKLRDPGIALWGNFSWGESIGTWVRCPLKDWRYWTGRGRGS
jgi:hypothetical protein